MSSPADEGLETRQLDSENPFREHHMSTLSGKVLKNNYLKNPDPTGNYVTLQIRNMYNKPSNDTDIMNMPTKKDHEHAFVRRNAHVNHHRVQIEDRQIQLPSNSDITRQLNDNFEITSNGMMKMKKQKPKIFEK
jgi:acetyltransferase-like isoleucine patch superfamily enzyme